MGNTFTLWNSGWLAPSRRARVREQQQEPDADLVALIGNEVLPRLRNSAAEEARSRATDPDGGLTERRGPGRREASRTLLENLAELDRIELVEIVRENCPPQAVVERLTKLVLQQNLDGAMALMLKLHQSGVHRHRLYLDYLQPAARRLGELWSEDRNDFTQVTLATACLQQLLRETSSLWDTGEHVLGHHHRILLLPAAGEQHQLGISVLGEIFRDAGWDVCGGPRFSSDQVLRLVGREHMDVVGLSAASHRRLDELARQIDQLRRESRNKDLRVLVGGWLFVESPELADRIGADGYATDGSDAVQTALELLGAGASA